MTPAPAAAADQARGRLQRRALRLEYATIAWNAGEAIFTIILGIAAGSLALIGFGADSIIEMFASSVVVWHVRPGHAEDNPGRTRLALRMVASAFLGLGVVLLAVSIQQLAAGRRAGESLAGIVYLSFTAVVMFGLAFVKKRTAEKLQSAPLRSEAAMTFLDGILSTLTLIGLSLNVVFSWAWADPLAALVVGLAAIRESRQNWREAADI